MTKVKEVLLEVSCVDVICLTPVCAFGLECRGCRGVRGACPPEILRNLSSFLYICIFVDKISLFVDKIFVYVDFILYKCTFFVPLY